MSGLSIDFTGINDGFDPVPAGTYNCTVYEVTVRDNKAKDSKYLNWQLAIQDKGYENRRVFFTTSLKPQALWKLKQVLERIAPEEDWNGQVDVSQIIDTVTGLPCRAVITINTDYNNNDVVDLLAPAEGEDDDYDLPI